MQKRWKKLSAIIMAGAMTATMFTGCGQEGTKDPSESKTQSTQSTVVSAEQSTSTTENESPIGTYPVEGGGEITYWGTLSSALTGNFNSFGETEIGKWLSEKTGITVKYLDEGASNESFDLMVASGELPDVIDKDMLHYAGGPAALIEEGIILPLNDIIDQYCPNFKAYLEAHPEVDKQIKTDDGIYYTFPRVYAASATYSNGSYIRKDWLDELGLEAPTTVDEWYDVLVKIRDAKNVVPFTCAWGDLMVYNPIAYAYGVGGGASFQGFSLDDDGNVVYVKTSDKYKEFLMLMNKWYEEGLIEQDVASIDSMTVRAKMTNGEAAVSNGWITGTMLPTQQAGQAANPDFQLLALPTPVLNEGDKATDCYTYYTFTGSGVSITPDCKDIELAARFLDYGYSEEGHMLLNYGVEDVSYTMVDGKPVFTDDVLYNFPEGWSTNQSLAKYTRSTHGGAYAVNDDAYLQSITDDCVRDALQIWGGVEGGGYKHLMYNVSYTAEEADEYNTIINNLKTYVDEMSMGFVLGTESFDKWDEYVATIESMGVERATEINKAAVARYVNR